MTVLRGEAVALGYTFLYGHNLASHGNKLAAEQSTDLDELFS